jgi:hypothetical protein
MEALIEDNLNSEAIFQEGAEATETEWIAELFRARLFSVDSVCSC